MNAFYPCFSAQVFEIQPDGLRHARGHRLHVRRGWVAGEGFDDHIGRNEGVRRSPRYDVDAEQRLGATGAGVNLGRDEAKGMQIIHDQPHGPIVLRDELARQSPADADVAVVVDHAAEEINGDGHDEQLFCASDSLAVVCAEKSSKSTLNKTALH